MLHSPVRDAHVNQSCNLDLLLLFLFWTLIAELVIDSISVLARTCPRLAGEDLAS